MPIPVGTAPALGLQPKTRTSDDQRQAVEDDPLMDVPPSYRTPSAAAPEPLEVSGPQLPTSASAASGAAPAAVSDQRGTATPIAVGLPDASLPSDPPSAPAMTRATAKLRPKAKMSGRLSSTIGLGRTAKRLSKFRKPASHSSRNAAVSDVHDPTYRPDPASRPRAKSIWLADEDEAISTDMPAPSSPRPSKKSKRGPPKPG
eukprot:s1927_g5.t1